ncbi:putative HTH DNA binding protein [Caulobacter phage CcrRogue]|uniref:Putative HTH DNA binding protein n=1 Tax=Caulobacter phage CcrRogue TaxID=2927986 RepID=K4JS14_9CAUD|nr:putative HTH DNA binding protein [Caulobacter phage CcrRogue]AFU86518.1 putative HTH DNA binding protein [Caulobacter phage CcrRogue]
MKRAQCKAGRLLLGWTQAELADAAGCAVSTVADYERGARRTDESIIRRFVDSFSRRGVRFTRTSVIHPEFKA